MARYEPPLAVTIATPHTLERQYGVLSTRQKDAKMIFARANNEERELIEQEATALGITFSMYVRCCVLNVSHKLREHRQAWLKEQANANVQSDTS